MVLDGTFDIHFRDKTVHKGTNEFIIVPKWIEHKPLIHNECNVVLLEKKAW